MKAAHLLLSLMLASGLCLTAEAQTAASSPSLWEESTPYTPLQKREYRAVWLTTLKNLDWPSKPGVTPADEARQKAELCTILDTLQAVGINTVLLQTRLRGDVIYPSLIEPFATVITGKEGRRPSYDPLEFAVAECHRRGMQCHAWIVALQVKDNQYVDPSQSAVVEHLCNVVDEVVRNYDIDGIHLDYIRYPESAKGNAQWRRDNVTRCMRAVYNTVKERKPWVCVSAATLGKYRDTKRYSSSGWNAYNTVFQEAQAWTSEGIVDALFPMLYYRDKHYYPFVADWAEHAHGKHFVAGLGIYQLDRAEQNWELTALRSQIEFMRSFEGSIRESTEPGWGFEKIREGMVYGSGASGYALFRAGFIMNNTKGIRNEIRAWNARPALVPAIPSSPSVSPSAPEDLHGSIQGDKVTLRWAPSTRLGQQASTPEHTVTTHSEEPVKYNLYRSIGSPVDIANGRHLWLTYQEETSLTATRSTRRQTTYYAVTAIDRYGNESAPVYWADKVLQPKKTDKTLHPIKKGQQ
ncbi:MAG: family 10 glycosylhydrolase [Bacteroidaceae bacterium]|nr:family 10 glycosylhydrolase [Bacteroidaceae bacterium]